MTYAKLIDGQPRILAGAHNIANATEAQLAEYAAAHGYKRLGHSDPRGRYYNLAYEELFDSIREFYIPWALEDAKADAMQRVQEELTSALSERVTIPCDGFSAGIVYDGDALTNAAGMSVGDPYIDAANNVAPLTAEGLDAIQRALKAHRMGLYAAATVKREQIAAAEDVDAVEAALAATPPAA